MLFGKWFLVPTLVTYLECANCQFDTSRKNFLNFLLDSDFHENKDIHSYEILISDESSTYMLSQFWKNTGLCPPDPHQDAFNFFLSSDMKQNLFHIGSLPFDGITRIRMHWLLDLIQMEVKPDSSIIYNFTYLDQLMHELWKNDLYVGFELMGNPSNYFTDFENTTQIHMWKDLVQTIGRRYIDLYGIQYLKEWIFETWNEPDHHDFDNLNFTIQGFLNYYDACSEGLKQADKRLRFGGPGGSCRVPGKGKSPICWALLNHCIRGRNFFTGKIGTRLDFISFHKKGNASTLPILDEEWETIEYIRNEMKIPKNIPFYNDEADPMKNWALPRQWRADVTYAAMVVKIILSHIDLYFMQNKTRDVYFTLLSNDNAFMSYFPYQFSQRTLLARFQVNNTNPKFVEFIKKPVFSVFGLLSQLCHNILHAEIYDKGKQIKNMNEFGIIATHCLSDRNQIVIIMYNSADSLKTNVTFDIDLIFKMSALHKKATNARWLALELNNRDTNPYIIWQTLGMPAYPSSEQFSMIKEKEEPSVNGPWKIKGSPSFRIRLKMLNPGVTMVNVCITRSILTKVGKIRFFQIRNTTLQISWSDRNNRCVLTYNIEYSVNFTGPYTRLNVGSIVFPSYTHSCNENDGAKSDSNSGSGWQSRIFSSTTIKILPTEGALSRYIFIKETFPLSRVFSDIYCSIKGFYRIYAVDYWRKYGPFSKPAKYSKIF